MKSIISKLKSHIETESDSAIYSYIEANINIIPNTTLDSLSNDLYMSPSSVRSYLNRAGYSSYTNFQYDIKNISTQEKIVTDPFRIILNKEIEGINELVSGINEEYFEKVAQLITSSHTVVIHSRGLNYAVSKYLYSNLITIDVPCIFITELNLIRSVPEQLDSNTIVLFISQDFRDEVYLDILQTLRSNNIPTALITFEDTYSVSSQLIDYRIPTNDIPSTTKRVDTNSRIGFFFVAQLLIETVNSIKQSKDTF